MAVIDRAQAETMAWEMFVGNQTPEEFVEHYRARGITDAEDMVFEYLSETVEPAEPGDPLWPEVNAEPPVWTWADLPDLLTEYIVSRLSKALAEAINKGE